MRLPCAHYAGAGGLRFSVEALLDGRPFETFHLDVGWGDPVVEAPEELPAPSLLGFADIEPLAMPCYPITQHLAEKLHAYTRPHASGESSWVMDLVDIILMAEIRSMRAETLVAAFRATFEDTIAHALPNALPDPPSSWTTPFRRLASEVGLESERMDVGPERARCFLDPLLQGNARGLWDPQQRRWSASASRRFST